MNLHWGLWDKTKYPDASYPDRIPLTWRYIWNLCMLKLHNPERAERFRWGIVDFGIEQKEDK